MGPSGVDAQLKSRTSRPTSVERTPGAKSSIGSADWEIYMDIRYQDANAMNRTYARLDANRWCHDNANENHPSQ